MEERKAQLEDKAKEIDDEFLALNDRQQELRKTLQEEAKWIEAKQAEHVELAKVISFLQFHF